MKISRELLQKLIKEEKAKLDEELGKTMKSAEDTAKDTKEVEPDELADTLEKKIDFMIEKFLGKNLRIFFFGV